jgi:hypothetical protein
LATHGELGLCSGPRYERVSRISNFTVCELLLAIGTEQRPARLHSEKNTPTPARESVPYRSFLINPWLALENQWQDIETDVFDELRHRIESLLTIRVARHDNGFPAGRQWLRCINEAVEIVLPEFRLDDR